MKSQVFGCPSCQQPFQVAESQSGQVVQCPSCAQAVEIPTNTFSDIQQLPPDQQVYACPSCSGQFGITSSMFGQHVGCPHCQASILVQAPDSQAESVAAPAIVTDSSISKRTKKSEKRWKSDTKSGESNDMFAPGFEKPKTSSKPPPSPDPQPETPIQPVRRSEESKPSPNELAASTKTKRARKKSQSDKLHPPTKKRGAKIKAGKPSEGAVPTKQRDTVSPPTPADADGLVDPSPNETVDVEVVETDTVDSEVVDAEVTDSEVVKPDVVDEQIAESAPDETLAPDDQRPDAIDQSGPIDHLLPLRFDVLDPTRMRFDKGKDQFKVLLPDGEGGTKQFDQRLLRVKHEGEHVALVAMTEQERQRRRLIQNVIAIVIGIIIMGIAFMLLR